MTAAQTTAPASVELNSPYEIAIDMEDNISQLSGHLHVLEALVARGVDRTAPKEVKALWNVASDVREHFNAISDWHEKLIEAFVRATGGRPPPRRPADVSPLPMAQDHQAVPTQPTPRQITQADVDRSYDLVALLEVVKGAADHVVGQLESGHRLIQLAGALPNAIQVAIEKWSEVHESLELAHSQAEREEPPAA